MIWGLSAMTRSVPANAPTGYAAGMMMARAVGLVFFAVGAWTLYKAVKGGEPAATEPESKRSWALYAAFVGCFLLIVGLLARRSIMNFYAGFLMGQAQADHMAGETARESAHLEKALRLDPNFPPALARRAALRLSQGDAQGAVADSEAALKIDGKFWQAHQVRCAAYAAKNDSDGSVSACEAAIGFLSDPGHIAGARVSLGDAWMGKKEFVKAIAAYDEALKLQPSLNPALARRGVARMMIGPKEQALADLTKATQADPAVAAAYGTALAALQNPAWTPVVPAALNGARFGLLGLARLELNHYSKVGKWGDLVALAAMPETAQLTASAGGADLPSLLKTVFADGAAKIEAQGEGLVITATALDPRATVMSIRGDANGFQLPELVWEAGKFDAQSLLPPPKPKRKKR